MIRMVDEFERLEMEVSYFDEELVVFDSSITSDMIAYLINKTEANEDEFLGMFMTSINSKSVQKNKPFVAYFNSKKKNIKSDVTTLKKL